MSWHMLNHVHGSLKNASMSCAMLNHVHGSLDRIINISIHILGCVVAAAPLRCARRLHHKAGPTGSQ